MRFACAAVFAYFYPRPRGGGRHPGRNGGDAYFSISIHALRVVGDDYACSRARKHDKISIHALRVEGDYGVETLSVMRKGISIHALRVEGDGEFVEADI